ncbi:hypothetical protein D0T50_08870 [Bacteroides sp. 214]|nr:hypothetical protein [Bacteroides sp. 214]
MKRYKEMKKGRYTQIAESTIVSIRIFLIITIVHIILCGIFYIHMNGYKSVLMWLLIYIAPVFVFIATICLNQLSIYIFNLMMSEHRYIPVVDNKGYVLGKVTQAELENKGNTICTPVIRIAVIHEGMLYLIKQPQLELFEGERLDIPMESTLYYGETLDDAIKRILQDAMPMANNLKPVFSIRYNFKNRLIHRQVYLYLLPIKDEKMFNELRIFSGKLWTMNQIKDNLDKNYFSELFEHEFDHLQTIIDTREKYKES